MCIAKNASILFYALSSRGSNPWPFVLQSSSLPTDLTMPKPVKYYSRLHVQAWLIFFRLQLLTHLPRTVKVPCLPKFQLINSRWQVDGNHRRMFVCVYTVLNPFTLMRSEPGVLNQQGIGRSTKTVHFTPAILLIHVICWRWQNEVRLLPSLAALQTFVHQLGCPKHPDILHPLAQCNKTNNSLL